MTSLSRFALAALLTGAVALPALAADEHAAPAPTPHATRVAAGPEATPPAPGTLPPGTLPPGKPTPGKPGGAKSGEKPAAITGTAGSHAPVTQATPPADAVPTAKTN